MQSSNETPISFNFGGKLFNALLNQGLVFVVMGITIWIMFNWVQENRKEDKAEIEELRQLVEDCALSKKERMELKIDGITLKMDQILKAYEKDN